jgi:hypothetical protein
VEVFSNNDGKSILYIVDRNGNTIIIRDINLVAGLSVIEVDVTSLSSGIYFVTVISQNRSNVISFVKAN